MSKISRLKSNSKIIFLFDERLSHDRKKHFYRAITLMKAHFDIEILPSRLSEKEVIERVENEAIPLVILPWYLYLTWKKLENFHGLLRLDGPTIAGYFADAVLPFEFSHAPNYHRTILLDFYRFDTQEMELMVRALLHSDRRAGFAGMIEANDLLFHMDWYDHDAQSTRVLDTLYKLPLFQNANWSGRLSHFHFYLHALWELFGKTKRSLNGGTEPCAELEITEFNQRLAIKFVFESTELSLKHMLQDCWPNQEHPNQAIQEMIRNADFIRAHHYPESQKIEITAFFIPSAPSIHYPNEVRGFWIEPLKMKYLKTNKNDHFTQKKTIQLTQSEKTLDQLNQATQLLRTLMSKIEQVSPTQKAVMLSQLAAARQIIDSLEKKLAETRKAA